MQMKLATLAQALVIAAGLALAPAAFAQTAPSTATPAAPTAPAASKVAKPAEVKTAQPQQTADAACAVHKKDSKEFKDCVEKHKVSTKPVTKDPAKKS